ncbi:carboxypeptidase-like regulatory domain-containing protein [Limnoglobus roseus]|uniref:Carboxypeptidase regulatory-like domain-containing protein n=1 Tax=Limnoglobus roseus TaxID=2598579 RepID=A0A5C1AIF5_9BACT|nr:carboxypeptidase-like regulatory domain-containing protein [Limnoglobus roseus]QEL17947.1 carboxypeptidase regulatory-like domain-containing protein [Limnoglobus roseus]
MSRVVRSLCVPALVLTLLAGCGSGYYPVTGKVTYPDGSPLPAGTVIGEATINGQPVSVQGNIEADGNFRLGTDKPGGGVPPGSYKFAVMPIPIPDGKAGEGMKPAVDGKYTRYKSSGIALDVKSEQNVLNITVTK